MTGPMRGLRSAWQERSWRGGETEQISDWAGTFSPVFSEVGDPLSISPHAVSHYPVHSDDEDPLRYSSEAKS